MRFRCGGGINLKEILRLEGMINENKSLMEENRRLIEEIKELKADLTRYGMVKLTDSVSVTDSSGLALAATEKNAGIDGTLANRISILGGHLEGYGLEKIRFLGVQHIKDSEIGNVAAKYSVPDRCMYMFTQYPQNDSDYIHEGASYFVIGMEYGNHRYGSQYTFGSMKIKYRYLQDWVWDKWKTVTGS